MGQDIECRFSALCALSAELSAASSFDDLCRHAVIRGRNVLGFDRMGLWFQTSKPLVVEGSFGTDEDGVVRDERGCRLRCSPESDMGRLLQEDGPTVLVEDSALLDHNAQAVGRGAHLLAALWDGKKIIGCLSTDNLLHRDPITNTDRDLLRMYAITLGHLCTRKRAEDALVASHEEQRKLLEIVNRSPAVVVRWELAGRRKVDFVSRTVSQLGYEMRDVLEGRVSWLEILHPDDRVRLVRQVQWHQAQAGSEWSQRYRLRCADGAYRWYEARHCVMTDAEGCATHVEGIFLDVSGRRELEIMVAEASRRERFEIGSALHDSLRQELAGLTYLASAAQRGSGDLPEMIRDALVRIEEQAGKTAADAQRIAKGLAPAGIDSEGLIVALRDLARGTADLYGVECQFQAHQKGAVNDPTAIDNLYYIASESVYNAIRHAEPTKVSIELWAGREGRLLVRDDGSGFDVDVSHNGLGLRMLNHRAEAIGAVLTITSTSDSGTIVECRFPNAAGAQAESGDRAGVLWTAKS